MTNVCQQLIGKDGKGISRVCALKKGRLPLVFSIYFYCEFLWFTKLLMVFHAYNSNITPIVSVSTLLPQGLWYPSRKISSSPSTRYKVSHLYAKTATTLFFKIFVHILIYVDVF